MQNRKNMWKTKNRKVLIRLRKDGMPCRRMVDLTKKQYPAGCRVELHRMEDPWSPVPSGTKGTVLCVDDAGQLHMQWDNGRTMALVPGADSFSRIDAPAKKRERSGDAR